MTKKWKLDKGDGYHIVVILHTNGDEYKRVRLQLVRENFIVGRISMSRTVLRNLIAVLQTAERVDEARRQAYRDSHAAE
jgi:hypothetical protein